jgi:ATP-dependent RNA helicase DOB1
VFSSIKKFDGEVFRTLSGSEFVQMAGRAGRRGLDKKGMVIVMVDQKVETKEFKKLLTSQSKNDPLNSQFTVSYNMMLNSLLMEDMGRFKVFL